MILTQRKELTVEAEMITELLGGHFGPEQKYLAPPPPPHRLSLGALSPSRASSSETPPLPLFFIETAPPPRPPPRTPPPQNRKNKKYPKRPPSTELICFEPEVCICNGNDLDFKRICICNEKFPQIYLCNGKYFFWQHDSVSAIGNEFLPEKVSVCNRYCSYCNGF